jgi:hypothetical protein
MKPITMRWVLVALSAVLAIALLASGNVVIGAIIAAMVAVRTVMLATFVRRRREFASRFPGRAGARGRRRQD